MLSESLKRTLPFLQIVADLPPKDRKRILKNPRVGGDKQIFDALHEMSYNTLKFIKRGEKLKPQQIKQLRPYVKDFQKICNLKNKKCPKKRKLLIQQGSGFLPFLIPTVVSLLSSVLSK